MLLLSLPLPHVAAIQLLLNKRQMPTAAFCQWLLQNEKIKNC